MKRTIHAERISYGIVLLLSAGAFFLARQFPRAEEAHSGPGSFPLALSVVLGSLALAGLLHNGRQSSVPEVSVPSSGEERRNILFLGGLTVGYLLLMPLLGFISSTALLCALSLMILGFRRPVQALASGFIAAFALYWIFGVLMNVALPKGWIG
jgi:putative tricarboxylic transport membrane protein